VKCIVPIAGGYLTKPSRVSETNATERGAALNFRFAEFEIDMARQELRRASAIVHVEPQVFDLLVYLIRNRTRTVSKDELFDAIWQGRVVSEATLSSRISAARRALGDSGNDQSFIRTLHKRGFRFVGDIEDDGSALARASDTAVVLDATAQLVPDGESLAFSDESAVALPAFDQISGESKQGCDAHGLAEAEQAAATDRAADAIGGFAVSQADPEPVPAAEGKASNWRLAARNLLATVVAAALATLPIVAAWWLLSPPSRPHAEGRLVLAGDGLSSADRLKPSLPLIAVLPFANHSGDSKRDYLADGITDSLISDLARALPGISIVPRDTAFTYKGHSADRREIGRELGVRYLLEGSVAPEKERVRVNTRLVETKEASQLWAERFDTELKSILQVQDEIVSRVSRAIGLQIVDLEARRSWRERPDSAEVIDLVLRGKAVLNLPSSRATMIEARGLFEQALKVEPNSADGLAGVASTLVFEFLNGYYEAEGDERLGQAERLLNHALAIKPRHLMALKANAALRRAQGRFDDAIAAAEAIIMENPGEPWAYKEIGLSTLYLGKPEEALDWFAKADRIGPRDPARWTWLDGRGHALVLLGRDEEAIRTLISALDANPKNISSHAFLAAAYALLGRSEEAHAALAAYLERHPGTRVSTFRTQSPVPLALTGPPYRQLRAHLNEGLLKAGMPE
jgi:TolB-like protein/DNA-binding winged helix-turn-helix (wHTH) protein/cytochrome c-type biogenesis protein CcmH/NrfG